MLPEESHFRSGEPVYADDLLNILRELVRLGRIIGVSPIKIVGSGSGFQISLDRTIYPGLRVGKADSGISALSGTTPGSGTVSIWKRNTDGTSSDSGEDVTAYNWSSAGVAMGAYIFLGMSEQGEWLVIFESCS